MKFECYFDGSITFNPGGDMKIGGLVYEVTDSKREKIFEFSESMPAKDFPNGTSNNVAEVLALDRLLAFFMLEEIQHKPIKIFGDSQVVINRVIRKQKDGKGIFIPFVNTVINTLESFSNIEFEWVRREKNTEADALTK